MRERMDRMEKAGRFADAQPNMPYMLQIMTPAELL